MTQNENAQRIAELNTIFMMLNDKGKESALTVLKALNFAQSVMDAEIDLSKKKMNHKKTNYIE